MDLTRFKEKRVSEEIHQIESAVFRRLVKHLRDNTAIQNIDIMETAGFCRNCLSKWYLAAAENKGIEMELEEAREIVYGMPYAEWKARYQKEASPEQRAEFENKRD